MKQSTTEVALSDMTITRANVIASVTGSLEIGIEKALMAERLIDKMKFQVTSFEYIKKSTGELRRAWGTLAENLMSAKVKGSQRKKNLNCINYYDVERGDFRSLLASNLVRVF